jgi:NADPH:quinone reductase-like Zn-dependent oxidoreductase
MHESRQVQFYELGGSGVLKTETVPIADPDRGEIRIKVEAIGLNRAENLYRAGYYIYQPSHFPSPIGYEAVGVVEAVGKDVTEFIPGDRVNTIPAFKMSEYGVFGETAIVPVYAVTKYPNFLSLEEAASVWMQYITAYGALIHYGNLQRGQVALFTAATGGLGVAAIQIARQVGAISIATTRSQAKKPLLESLNPDHIIVTGEEDLQTRVLEITQGRGADFVWDAVGGKDFPKLVDLTALGGQINIYGALDLDSVAEIPMPWFQMISKGIAIRGYTLFELTYNPRRFGAKKPYDPVAYPKAKEFILEGLESGVLKPVVAKVFSFDRIIEAHDYVEKNQALGKIVVKL